MAVWERPQWTPLLGRDTILTALPSRKQTLLLANFSSALGVYYNLKTQAWLPRGWDPAYNFQAVVYPFPLEAALGAV